MSTPEHARDEAPRQLSPTSLAIAGILVGDWAKDDASLGRTPWTVEEVESETLRLAGLMSARCDETDSSAI